MAITKAKKQTKKKPKKKTTILNVDGVDLPVTFNTNGRLDKKSQDAFDKIVNRKLLEGTTGQLRLKDGVEAVGFAGLVAVNYYGIDVLSIFLGQATKLVEDVVETAAEGVGYLVEALGAVGAFAGGDVTVFGNAGYRAVGMSKTAVKGTADELAASIEKERMSIAMTLTALGAAAADERFQHLRDRLKELSDPSPERQRNIADAFDYKLLIKKVAIATGMAYAEKKFLESYEFSEAVENIPVIQ